jgi:hypothetical protein
VLTGDPKEGRVAPSSRELLHDAALKLEFSHRRVRLVRWNNGFGANGDIYPVFSRTMCVALGEATCSTHW